MRKLLAIICLFIGIGEIYAQQPVVANIDPVRGYPSSRLVITGSGFGTSSTDLVVWFGSVQATITNVVDDMIQVEVPAQASAANITVINVSSGLASQSDEKFYPVYSGDNFDPAKTSTTVIPTTDNHVYDPCTCDLDGDGKPDVVTTKFDNLNSVKNSNLVLLHNESTIENFSFTKSTIPIGYPTTNIGCGDLNGDGKPDLYMSRGGTTRYNVFVLENTSTPGNITFLPLLSLPMQESVTSRRVRHKDLNGDGKPELVVTNSNTGDLIIFENTSAGNISFAAPLPITVAGASSTTGLEVQDMNGDGKPDIVVGQFMADNVFILENTTAGSISFASPKVLDLMGNSLLNLTTGDFDGNGKLDIAIVGNSGNRVFVFPNASTPDNLSFGNPYSTAVSNGPWGISTGDVDGDGKLDIVTTSIGQDNMTVLTNDSGNGTLSFTQNNIMLNKRSRNAVITDLDGDAKPDIIATAFVMQNYDVVLIRNTNCYQPKILNDPALKICPGQTVTLRTPPSPAVTFSWTKDGGAIGSNSNELAITQPGVYEVTATSESGNCVPKASITVGNGSGTIPGNPVASNNGPACIDGTLTLSANFVSGATYQWSGPNNFSSTEREPIITGVTNNVAGIYSVTIKSGDCQSSESETTVKVVNLPEFNVVASGDTEVCAGSNVTLNTELLSGYSYQWLKDGSPVTGATSNTYQASTSGLYSVRVDDNGSDCYTLTNEVQVNVYSIPDASFTQPANGCTGQEITFNNTAVVDASAPVAYSWNFGNGDTSTEKHPAYSFNVAGTKTVRLDVSYTGVAGCTDFITKGIAIKDPIAPDIQATETAVCPGGALDLSIAGTYSNILWSTSQTTSTITISEPGTYSVTADDANGCSAYAEIAITPKTVPPVKAAVAPDPADTTILAGNEVQLEATGAEQYSWTPSESLSDGTIPNPIASPEQTTTYTVTGISAAGCSSTDKITIVVEHFGEPDITPHKAFSPNSTQHPTWHIENIRSYQDKDCTMSIFNESGSLVFRTENYNNEWDATYNGKTLPEGIYYYVFGCEGLKPKTGSVLVVR